MDSGEFGGGGVVTGGGGEISHGLSAPGEMFAVSAGLDLISGVFGYLSSLNASSIASSRGQMIINEANANAQRYAEKAAADQAQQKAMFLASGVTLQGSPLDVLDTSARLAKENIDSIMMSGAAEALDQNQQGGNALTQGRNAIIGGVAAATGVVGKSQLTPAQLSIYATGANS